MTLKAFRLFISSTFADFAKEREVLHTEVFPRVERYCLERGYQFHPIDLRWGVSEEAQLDQKTVALCLNAVKASKSYPPPNFLIMLGNRYGWVPLPYAIERGEFEAIQAFLREQQQATAADKLAELYCHDLNHPIAQQFADSDEKKPLTTAYVLKARENELADSDTWQALENAILPALQMAANALLEQGQLDSLNHDKYFSSLTSQEIYHGLGAVDKGQSFAFLRDITGSAAKIAPNFIEDNPRLDKLKTYVKDTLPPDTILEAETSVRKRWFRQTQLDDHHLLRFAEKVESFLMTSIESYMKKVEETEQVSGNKLTEERNQHAGFRDEKLKIFFGREDTLGVIDDYLEASGNAPLILHGRSGMGKSALMARAIKAAQDRQTAPIIYRFVGASAASSDIRSLLTSIVEELGTHNLLQRAKDIKTMVRMKLHRWQDSLADEPGLNDIIDNEFELDPEKFKAQISELLSAIEQPAILFIDALDQLQRLDSLNWLPHTLPPGLKIVMSVLNDEVFPDDSQYYHILKRKYGEATFVNLEALGTSHAEKALEAMQQQTRRLLTPEQTSYLLVKFEASGASPLFLKTAFEIAKSWHSWDKVEDKLEQKSLAADVPALIAQFLNELVSEHHHDRKMVTRTLGYLAAARFGLSEKELTDILSYDKEVMTAIANKFHENKSGKLPPSVWTRLEAQLSPLLVEKKMDGQPLLRFFHRQISEAVATQYYEPEKQFLHEKLVAYFESLNRKEAIGGKEERGERPRYNIRTLSELPYQLHKSSQSERLKAILLDPAFMVGRLTAHSVQPLLEDYRVYGYEAGWVVNLVGRALSMSADTLSRDKRQLIPHLLGRLQSKTDPELKQLLDKAWSLLELPAIAPIYPTLTSATNAQGEVLSGHSNWIYALTLLPDGRLASCSADNTIRLWNIETRTSDVLKGHDSGVFSLAVVPDGRLASGSDDNTIRLWNLATGTSEIFKGHDSKVDALVVLPHGRIASGSRACVIHIWDIMTGCNSVLKGHEGFINALAVLPDGRLVSASHDKTIRIWNIETGVSKVLEGHDKGVNSLVILPDGRIASGSADQTIRIWDITSNTFTILRGHQGGIWALAILPETEYEPWRIASGASDNTIRLWDVVKDKSIVLDGHGASVRALTPLTDGRLASASWDKTIRLWDVKSNTDEKPEGHGYGINSFTPIPDGRMAIACTDGTIRLWDMTTGKKEILEGHDYEVLTLVILPDGRLASGAQDNTIRLWDLATRKYEVLDAKGNGINSLVLLPDGKLASASDDGNIRLWNLTHRKNIKLTGHSKSVRVICLLPDGRIASGSSDGTIRIWNVTTRESIVLEGHRDRVYALKVLPDGRLASGSVDMTLRIWDIRTGESSILRGHKDEVWALDVLVASEGKPWRLVSASRDDTVQLWDVTSGVSLASFENDAGLSITAIHTLPDGDTLLAGDRRGRIHWLKTFEQTRPV